MLELTAFRLVETSIAPAVYLVNLIDLIALIVFCVFFCRGSNPLLGLGNLILLIESVSVALVNV